MKNLLIMLGVFGGLSLAACGGKVVVDGFPSGTGGQGGQSGTTTAFSASAATGSFTTGSFSTAAGSSSTKASSGGGCASCFEVLTGSATLSEICDDEAVVLFKELFDCACSSICKKACSDSFCMSFTSTNATCGKCLGDASNGCGFELQNCANN
jgi:hypothetical protein